MSVDPDLRIALGFILLLRLGIGIFYSKPLSEFGIFAELRRLPKRRFWEWFAWALLTIPVFLFVLDVDGLARVLAEINITAAVYSIMLLPDLFRWLLLIPAVAGLLLGVWSRQSAVHSVVSDPNHSGGKPSISGPFRVVRFPQVSADLLLFGPLSVGADNWGAAISFIAACLIWSGILVPRAEIAWIRLLGDEYPEYAARTGAILPRAPHRTSGMTQQYSVPKRFGVSAIIALTTMFAVIFGGINLLQSQVTEFQLTPTLHLFFVVELMAIWVGQMRFGQSPRSVSTMVGAILLPLFAFFTIPIPPSTERSITIILLFFFGGLIGYCLGTLAAGLFMFLDWVSPPSVRPRSN